MCSEVQQGAARHSKAPLPHGTTGGVRQEGHREREGHQQTCLAQPESVGYQVCDFPWQVSPSLTVMSAAGSFPGPSFVPGAYLCGGTLHNVPLHSSLCQDFVLRAEMWS